MKYLFLLNFIRVFHCRYFRHCRNNKASIVMLSKQKFTRQYAQVYYQYVHVRGISLYHCIKLFMSNKIIFKNVIFFKKLLLSAQRQKSKSTQNELKCGKISVLASKAKINVFWKKISSGVSLGSSFSKNVNFIL